MYIYRSQIELLLKIISEFEKNEDFSLMTKYKILKIKKTLEEEAQYNFQILKEFVNKYGTINEDGEILIKKEFIDSVNDELEEYNKEQIELPDITFSIKELSVTKIDWRTLEILMPLIKDE